MSIQAFFAMGGHGLYVWGSFGVTLLLMLLEPLLTRYQYQQTLKRLARIQRIQKGDRS